MGRNNRGARKLTWTPRLRKKRSEWQNKIGKKCKKKLDPEISRGARKLARTPKLLKKNICFVKKKNNQLLKKNPFFL